MKAKDYKYYSVGFNHETCPLDLREALAIGEHETDMALRSLQSEYSVSEAVILSTCNRTEIFSFASNFEEIISWFSSFRGFEEAEISHVVYQHCGNAVVRHAFRVAAGLDSMVLGETQILGQLKNSVRIAEVAGTLGPHLRKLFDTSFSVAKYIRTNTDLGAHSVSLAAASVKVGERIFDSLVNTTVLFVGAGEMNRICAEYFSSLDLQCISFANRTMSRAKHLADTLGGNYLPLSDLSHKLAEFDVVVSCTGSPIPIISKGAIEKALEVRRNKPMLLIDLAVPRDIETQVSELEDVFVYTVDDLGEIIKDGMKNREAAAADAEKIINDRLVHFQSKLDREKTVPVIKKFRQYGEQIMQIELEKALALIAKGEAPETVVKSLSRAISNKFMDEPSRALSNDSRDQKSNLSEALQRLFRLDQD
ncbi:MAG: glutamyl-tRNA reductase [Burkholderiales bacterium]|nr:glutamyl-tRNA reductase [Burkholderiales bacterium]